MAILLPVRVLSGASKPVRGCECEKNCLMKNTPQAECWDLCSSNLKQKNKIKLLICMEFEVLEIL